MIDARDAQKNGVYRAGKHFAVRQGTLACRMPVGMGAAHCAG